MKKILKNVITFAVCLSLVVSVFFGASGNEKTVRANETSSLPIIAKSVKNLSEIYDSMIENGGVIYFVPETDEDACIYEGELVFKKTFGKVTIRNYSPDPTTPLDFYSVKLCGTSTAIVNNPNLFFEWKNAPVFEVGDVSVQPPSSETETGGEQKTEETPETNPDESDVSAGKTESGSSEESGGSTGEPESGGSAGETEKSETELKDSSVLILKNCCFRLRNSSVADVKVDCAVDFTYSEKIDVQAEFDETIGVKDAYVFNFRDPSASCFIMNLEAVILDASKREEDKIAYNGFTLFNFENNLSGDEKLLMRNVTASIFTKNKNDKNQLQAFGHNLNNSTVENLGNCSFTVLEYDFENVLDSLWFGTKTDGILSIVLPYGASVKTLKDELENLGKANAEYLQVKDDKTITVSADESNGIVPEWNIKGLFGTDDDGYVLPDGEYVLSGSIDEFSLPDPDDETKTVTVKNSFDRSVELDLLITQKNPVSSLSLTLEFSSYRQKTYSFRMPFLKNATSLCLSYKLDGGSWVDYKINGITVNLLAERDEYRKAGGYLVDGYYNYDKFFFTVDGSYKKISVKLTVQGEGCLFEGTSNAFVFDANGTRYSISQAQDSAPVSLDDEKEYSPIPLIIVVSVAGVCLVALVIVVVCNKERLLMK